MNAHVCRQMCGDAVCQVVDIHHLLSRWLHPQEEKGLEIVTHCFFLECIID